MRAEIKDIDFSDAMRSYFEEVRRLLVTKHHLREEIAQSTVDQFFSIDVSPMERVFAMHTDAERLAADLASSRGN